MLPPPSSPPTLHTTHTFCLHILPPTHTFALYEAPEKNDVVVAAFHKKKKKKKIKNPSQCCNLFWADAVFSERAFGVWFDCLNVTLLIGKPQCLVVLGRGSLLGEQLHLYYLPRFDVWLKHLCVQLCWRWSSTQENLVFFSSTGRSVGPMNASCRSWYFDLHVGGLLPVCFQLPSSSAVSSVDIFQQVIFIFSLPHSHNRKRENKVCLLNMFMVTSRRGTSRVEIEERKKVRAAELRKCSVCVTMCLCVWVTQSCAQTLLISSLWFLWLMRGYTCTNLTFFSLFLCCFCHCWCDASLYTDVVALRWFFSQFMCSCSFPVAPSSGWSRSTPPPRSYSLYSSPLSVALARFPHYSLSHTPLFVCVLCGCALMGGSYSVGLRLAGKGLRGLAVRCV